MTIPARPPRALTWVVDGAALPARAGWSESEVNRERDMIDRDDRDYYTRRAQHERAIAARSTDTMVAMAHCKMADEYERRIATVSEMASSG